MGKRGEWKVVVVLPLDGPLVLPFFSFPFGVVYFSTDVLAALHFVSVTSIHVQASFVFLAFFSHDPSTSIHPRNPPTREEVQSSLLARSRPVRVSRVTPSKKLGYSKK
jgi:hypothetical protein